MIIVAGWLDVAPEHRDRYLDGCRSAIEQARREPGCSAFHLAADPLEPGRINVFERWDDVASVERFRQSGPADEQLSMITGAQVDQYEIAAVTPLT